MELVCASFNVLADAYLAYGQYDHVPTALLQPGARLPWLERCINGLGAHVVCLQEVEPALLERLKASDSWQTHWAPKAGGEPDGCAMLVRRGLRVDFFDPRVYSDNSCHVLQLAKVEGLLFANTHLKWAPADALPHPGVRQASELLEVIGASPAIICADGNDRPGGPVRALLAANGFVNAFRDDMPTAFVNGEPAALDFIMVRGHKARGYVVRWPINIPRKLMPSDHVPVMARIKV